MFVNDFKGKKVCWHTGHCHWIRLTYPSKFWLYPKGHLQEKTLIAMQSRKLLLNIICEYRKIVNCQTRARNSHKEFPSQERCDSHFPNRCSQKHNFYCVLLFALTRQELSSMRTTLLKSNFRNIIVELHSSGIVV